MSNITYQVQHWLPGKLTSHDDGSISRAPATPCPDVLNTEEACRFLQLDVNKSPKQALQTIRDAGQLQGFMQSGRVMFLLKDLIEYLETRKRENPA